MKCLVEGCNRKAALNGMCIAHADQDELIQLWNDTVMVPVPDDTQEVTPVDRYLCAVEDCPFLATEGKYCRHHAQWSHLF